jgi:hypothetical protein
MDENPDTVTSSIYRDPAASILFGIAIFLIVFLSVAVHHFAVSRQPALLMAALLLTGAFALVGMVLGLMRGLQSGRLNKDRNT